MYGHRQQSQQPAATGSGVGSSRIPDLLEALRAEYEAVQQECNFMKHQREDLDTKLHDIGLVQKILFDLERTHIRMKQQYEDEIRKLKLELEICNKPVNQGVPAAFGFHPLPQLEHEMQLIGASFLAAPVPGIPESSNGGYFVKRSSDNEHNLAALNVVSRGSSACNIGRTPASRSSVAAEDSLSAAPKDTSGMYDWLVVYSTGKDKDNRPVNTNLMHNLVHDGVICACRFSPDGNYLALAGNRAVFMYNARTGQRLATFSDPTMSASSTEDMFYRTVCITPDQKMLISGAEDSLIRVWDIESKKLLYRLNGHEQDVYTIELYNNGRNIASGSGDKTVKLWDLETQKCLMTLHAGTPDSTKDSGITALAVSPNQKFLVAGSLDRLIRIWELPSGNPVDVIEGHNDSIYSIRFVSDGAHLLSGSLDKSLRVWEFESADNLKGAKCKFDLIGHKDFVLSVASSPDGRFILTGSKDRSVQCWDISTGQILFMLQGHKNSVIGIEFSPNGQMFCTASGDARARIWSFDTTNSIIEAPEPKQRRISSSESVDEDHDIDDDDEDEDCSDEDEVEGMSMEDD